MPKRGSRWRRSPAAPEIRGCAGFAGCRSRTDRSAFSEAMRRAVDRAAQRAVPGLTTSAVASHRLARARARIGRRGVPIALEREAEFVVAPVVTACNGDPDRRPAHQEAVFAPVVAARNGDPDRRPAHQEPALGLVTQHRDELGAIVGLAAQRLVRDDDRGSRQCSWRDGSMTSFGMMMRSRASLASSMLSTVTAVQRRPASSRAIAVNTCVPIGLSGLRIVTGASRAALALSSTLPGALSVPGAW